MVKKLFILLSLMVISLTLINQSVSAESEDIYEEKYYLCDVTSGACDTSNGESDFIFDNTPGTSSNMVLSENVYTPVTFKLSNVLSLINPSDGFEVDSIELQINVGMHYTDNQVEYVTNNTDLVKEITYYGDYTGTHFLLNIDTENYNDFSEVNAEFTYTKKDGATLDYQTKIGSTFITVVYKKSVDEYENTIDVNTDYSTLPDTQNTFIDILSIDEYNSTTHSYKLTYSMGSNLYSFNVAIPDDMYNHVYSSIWQERIHFSEIPADQMSISTSPEGEQILYIQPDFMEPNKPALMDNGDEPDIVGFATINLTTMEYKIINKLQLYGVVNKESDRYACLYGYFPAEIENLLSITISYNYRINYLIGSSSWTEAITTYVQGDQYEGETPSWLWWVPGAGWGWAASTYVTGNVVGESIYDIPNVIEHIEPTDLPDEVDSKYVNDLGGDIYDKFSKELYKITLGQFQDGLFTAFSDERAYDIQEVTIINVLYEYKGVVYEASTEDIDSYISTPAVTPGFDSTNLEKILYAVVGVIGLLILERLGLFKMFKRNKWMIFVFIGLLLWFLIDLGIITPDVIQW